MSKLLALVLTALVALTVSASEMRAQSACFRCFQSTGEQAAHFDVLGVAPPNSVTWQFGGFHAYPGTYFVCAYWHSQYTQSAALAPGLQDGQDAVLVKLLAENKQAVLNVERSAIQFIDLESGDVLFHRPLPEAQSARLSAALRAVTDAQL